MSRIKPRIKHVSLAFMGDEWAESYIDFSGLLWTDVKDVTLEKMDNQAAIDRIVRLLKEHFQQGKGIDVAGEAIELNDADLDDFDLETQSTLFKLLSGSSDPNV